MKKEITFSEAVETAMTLIRDAQKSVYLTMRAEEEIKNPLPQEYFDLLDQRLQDGIQVIRVGFGSEKDFELIADKVVRSSPMYTFIRKDDSGYRRMILVDEKSLMHAESVDNVRKIYRTNDSEDIATFSSYFRSLLYA